MKREVRVERRSIPNRVALQGTGGTVVVLDGIEDAPLDHMRAVRDFVRRYAALDEACVTAHQRNDQRAFADYIDQKKRLEQTIRFVPAVAP